MADSAGNASSGGRNLRPGIAHPDTRHCRSAPPDRQTALSGNFLAQMDDDLPFFGSQLSPTAAVLNNRYIVACTHAFQRNLHLRQLANELLTELLNLVRATLFRVARRKHAKRVIRELDLVFMLLALKPAFVPQSAYRLPVGLHRLFWLRVWERIHPLPHRRRRQIRR